MAREPLYKSTIIIWSREHPTLHCDVEDLARKALYGNDTYLSSHKVELIDKPVDDPDWDDNDFFDIPDTGNEGWESEFPDEQPTKVENPSPSHVASLAGGEEDTEDREPNTGSQGST